MPTLLILYIATSSLSVSLLKTFEGIYYLIIMDYFSKFKKRMAPPKAQPTPSMQLQRFHKSWNYVHNIFFIEDKKANMQVSVSQTEIPTRLRQMVDLLVDEEARLDENSTGVCMEYFLKNGVLQILVNISEADYPEGIRGETIRTVASMIDLLSDRFLVHNAVHKPTVKLLRTCVLDERQSELYHEDLVDLMYIICSKIHGFPALLNIFFHDKQWLTTPQKAHSHQTPAIGPPKISQQSTDMAPSIDASIQDPIADIDTNPSQTLSASATTHDSKKPEYEFLLFTYLLRFVHREGRSGDFARTGLLFIMELATGQLGNFILDDSDFPAIMAAGLSALYSQLPRKLIIYDESELNKSSSSYLLAHSDELGLASLQISRAVGVEESNSKEFQYQLDSFLKLLEFCQDVLTRCPNVDISVALLQSIRSVFLENVLYPSVLECSDTDGSAVAVISYIDLILQTLQQDELVEVVVGFLMETEEDDYQPLASPRLERQTPVSDKRQSNIFAGVEVDQIKSSPYYIAPGRFTLKDLIFSRLKSSSEPTVVATLKLLKTLITRHCRYSLKLLNIERDPMATNFPRRASLPIPPPPIPARAGGSGGANGSSSHDAVLSPTSALRYTTVSHHIRELELFFSLIATIDPANYREVQAFGYEAYLRDAEATIESDWCYLNAPAMELGNLDTARSKRLQKMEKRRSFKYGQRFDDIKDFPWDASKFAEDGLSPTTPTMASTPLLPQQNKSIIPKHRLRPTDPLLQILLGLLSHFFAQSSELNLALTGVIAALAICPYRSLEGWLAFRETDRASAEDILDNWNQAAANNNNIADIASTTDGKGKKRVRIYGYDPDQKPVNEDDEDDDRSVDFALDRANPEVTASTTFKSFPPFFTLLRTLTQQVDYYRSEVDSFDQYLVERRRGLFFGDTAKSFKPPNLSTNFQSTKPDANPSSPVNVAAVIANLLSPRRTSQTRPIPSSTSEVSATVNSNLTVPPVHPVSSTSTSSISSASRMSTLAQDRSSVPTPSHSTPQKTPIIPVPIAPMSPLSVHAKRTREIRITPLFPANFVAPEDDDDTDEFEDIEDEVDIPEDEDDFPPSPTTRSVRAAAAAAKAKDKARERSTEISLSTLLNNVVILEESIKELAALLQVRRSLGIDEVRFA